MVTVVVPLTVAPAAGAAIAAVSAAGGGGGGMPPLLTVTLTLPAPVLPLASRADAVRVCVPSAASFVSNGSEIGPAVPLVVLPTVRPSSVSVTLLALPVAPLIQTTAHAVPLTVVPFVGSVIAMRSVAVGGGGGAPPPRHFT